MVAYFQKRFCMSKQGAKDLFVSIIWSTLLNISFALPALLVFIFLDDYMPIALNIKADPLRGILFYVICSLGVFMIMYIVAHIQYNATYTKIYGESAQARIKLAETLRQLPLAFFGKKDIADLSSTIMQYATEIEMLFSHAVPQLYASILSASLMTIGMFFYNWKMTLAMVWVVPLAFFIYFLSNNFFKKGFKENYYIKRDISDYIQEGLDTVQEVRSYNQEDTYLSVLHQKLDVYENNLIKNELLAGALLNIAGFTLRLGLATTVLLGAYLLSINDIGVFMYLAFIIIAAQIYAPFAEVMNNFTVLLYLDERINRLKEIDDMPRQTGSETFEPKNFDIEFDKVDFSYDEDVQTLKNVSFTAKQGEVTALIGPSGGGKTTAAKLSARFWDIDGGTIRLGGNDISKIDPETLLKNFAIVFQEVSLFNSSILENIRLGKKDASDDEIKAAAQLAQCDDFISKLPQGYDTLIGENGTKLSGGERQRISIARALLKDAPVILLDEATASLDVENETKIQEAIGTLIKNKTVLIIAHRMRTVLGADNIVVLSNGSVVETGCPLDLKEKGGVFAQMLEKQMASA